MKKKLILMLATGFGLGLSPVASGTVGSLPGVLAVIAMGMGHWAWTWQLALTGVAVILAIPLCGAAEEYYGRTDDGRIVADEYLTFPLSMLGLPWLAHPWLLAVGFVVNRVMDIIKPTPARQAQSFHGGLGIVLDDVISSFYALLANHALWWCFVKATA